ncbi:helix-turn-helix domain-containing protein [Faecalibacterium prausnitzii]|nr:helix-turn-helix transcriptional regulator [Faecalibacterium prausnitzii]
MYYDQHVCGARIQELRKSKGYTQEALAEAIDIDAKRISKIERGSNIGIL